MDSTTTSPASPTVRYFNIVSNSPKIKSPTRSMRIRIRLTTSGWTLNPPFLQHHKTQKSFPKMMHQTNKKETVLEWEENSNHIIIVCPSDKDVLCGRGRGNFFHEGNQRFLEIVGTNLHLYITASSRSQKSQVMKAVTEEVLEEGARILKQERGSCDWYEASIKAARLKVSVWLVKRIAAISDESSSNASSSLLRNRLVMPWEMPPQTRAEISRRSISIYYARNRWRQRWNAMY